MAFLWFLAIVIAVVPVKVLIDACKARPSRTVAHEGALGVLESSPQQEKDRGRVTSASPAIAEILASNELFHALDAKAVDTYARRFETRFFSKGSIIDDADSYGMAFVVRGKVKAFLDEVEHLAEQTTTPDTPSPHRHLLKSITSGQQLISCFETLSVIIRACWDKDQESGKPRSYTQSRSVTFIAVEQAELAVLPTGSLRGELEAQPHTLLHFVDAILRRLYFSTLPIANKYLGLGDEIAAFGEQLLSRIAIPSESRTMLRKRLAQIDRAKLLNMFQPLSLQDLTQSQSSPSFSFPTMLRERRRSIPLTRRSSKDVVPSDLHIHIPDGTTTQILSPPTSSLMSALSNVEGLDFNMQSLIEHKSSPSSLSQTVRWNATSLLLQCLGLDSGSESPYDTPEALNPFAAEAPLDFGELVFVSQGTKLIKHEKRYPAVFLLIDGRLRATLPRRHSHEKSLTENPSFEIGPGSIIGYESLLPNNRSLFEVVAETDAYLAIIPRLKLHHMLEETPSATITLAHNVLQSLTPLLQLVHFSTTWSLYEANKILSHDPTPSHSVVLSGRLRIKDWTENDTQPITHEVAAGESFGILDQRPHSKTKRQIRTVRKTQIAQMQLSSVEALAHRFPSLAFRFMNAVLGNPMEAPINTIEGTNVCSRKSEVQTIAIVSLSKGLDAEKWSRNLKAATDSLRITGNHKTTSVSLENVQQSLARAGASKADDALLENYLTQIEDNARLVLYIANLTQEVAWTRTCVAHADIVLFLASTVQNAHVNYEEAALIEQGIAARTMLILVDSHAGHDLTGVAAPWVQGRPWLTDGIHHTILASRRDIAESGQPNLSTASSDFHRLARRVFNKSIALVLGGGGARGISHLGVLKALEERNIPVDVVGGCSIGSFVGGVYACELSFSSTYSIVKEIAKELRPWRFLFDFTYPWLAVTTGNRFNNLIKQVFRPDMDLLDTRLEFYCGVTNLTKHGATQFLTQGSAWKSIRASMSFLGFVPPMTDRNGDLLFDGCYSSNLPVAYAAEHIKPDLILAVDIGPDMDLPKYSWGETYNGWEMAYRRFFNPYQANDLPRPYSWISDWLTYSRSLADIEVTKSSVRGCEYAKTPLGSYTALDFGKFDEIFKIGYEHATKWLDELEAKGVFERLAIKR